MGLTRWKSQVGHFLVNIGHVGEMSEVPGQLSLYSMIPLGMEPEVNISSYPVTPVTGLFFFSRAEIFKLGCFVQKYSDLGVSCRNICQVPFRVTQSEKCILEKVTQMVL